MDSSPTQKTAFPPNGKNERDLDGSAVPSLSGEYDHDQTRQGSLNEEKNSETAREPGSLENGSMDNLIEDKSRGVQEMECLVQNINLPLLCTIYGCLILLSYVLSMSESPDLPLAKDWV